MATQTLYPDGVVWTLSGWTGTTTVDRVDSAPDGTWLLSDQASATETIREAVKSTDIKVIQGMEVTGFINAKMKFHWPCKVSFDDCRVLPASRLLYKKASATSDGDHQHIDE